MPSDTRGTPDRHTAHPSVPGRAISLAEERTQREIEVEAAWASLCLYALEEKATE
jgi:hypothetical protein